MPILLTADWHLDDNPDNQYRWDVFDTLLQLIQSHTIQHIYILGDMVDRKDRHTSLFVNQLVNQFSRICEKVPVTCIKGNHDTPLQGPAFWEFFEFIRYPFTYVTDPTPDGRILLLPFTPDPLEAWRGIRFSEFDAALMHITVTGAISESGFELPGQKLPILPRSLALYSGDVHNPQKIRNLTYVGCPHPVRFGDDFTPRMLLLDEDTLEVAEEIISSVVHKHVIEISSLEALERFAAGPRDQARIRFRLDAADVDRWGEIEVGIQRWASAQGVRVASIEAEVALDRTGVDEADPEMAPDLLLEQFAREEGISPELLAVGQELLKE